MKKFFYDWLPFLVWFAAYPAALYAFAWFYCRMIEALCAALP